MVLEVKPRASSYWVSHTFNPGSLFSREKGAGDVRVPGTALWQREILCAFLIVSPTLTHLQSSRLGSGGGKTKVASKPRVSSKEPWVVTCSSLPLPHTPRAQMLARADCRKGRLLGRGIDTSREQWGLEEEISESPQQQLGRNAAQGYPAPLCSLRYHWIRRLLKDAV